MELKNYQKTSIDKLVKTNKKLLEKDGGRICVLKAPTGSGKTIIIAEFISTLVKELPFSKFAFIWISGYKLHEQSRNKLEKYLASSRFIFSYLDDVQNDGLQQNEIVFVNWHSLVKKNRDNEYTNIYMRDNEFDRNLKTYIEKTKDKGIQIILLVDESHYHYWSTQSQELIQDVITPKLTLEISATPKLEPSNEEIEYEEAGQVTIRFEDVVAEGMIKTNIVINMEIGHFTDFHSVADEIIIRAALQKQEEITSEYLKLGKQINPLVLIQLPSESEETSALDKTKLEFVEKFLNDEYSISSENNKLGIWLSDNKKNLDGIEDADNQTKVLIFKQAIALGWDCPRAHILVMFRDIQSPTFEIQTVGRILRMPEAKHYESSILNMGYVYTNLDRINISREENNPTYFNIHPSHRKLDYGNLTLPSIYLSRIDYGDLTLSFRKLFIQEANNYFGIFETDSPQIAKDKADNKLELLPNELTQPLIADEIIRNIDNVENLIGKVLHFSVPEDDIKFKYEYFAKVCSHPYAPIRSHTKIQQSIYDWFDKYLGYKNTSRLDIQRIVVCSENNQRVFKEIIETAKGKFKIVSEKELAARQTKKDISWDVPIIDYYNELYELTQSNNYAMDNCYLLTLRREPEKKFEQIINNNSKINWWYKNGVDKENYFCIPYIHPSDGKLHSFFPDYIIMFIDETVGVFDTKSGFTITSPETKAKSDALQVYINKEKLAGRKIIGGIVNSDRRGLFVFQGLEYTSDIQDSNWVRLDF